MGWEGIGRDGMGMGRDGRGGDGMGRDGMGWDEAKTAVSREAKPRPKEWEVLFEKTMAS